MPSTTDLREDPAFLRHAMTILIRMAVKADGYGDPRYREFLIMCAKIAHRELEAERARTPPQGELFKDLFR